MSVPYSFTLHVDVQEVADNQNAAPSPLLSLSVTLL
jgi:hypothetical protein